MDKFGVVVFCLCIGGIYSQMIKVNYVINNQLVAPNFNSRIAVNIAKGSPFIRVMEAAADLNKEFDFTGRYEGQNGYLIAAINGRASQYNIDKSYWEIYNASNVFVGGVSFYQPSENDVVTFNFTKDKPT